VAKKYEKPVPEIIKNLEKLLAFIGRPFYLLLTYTLIFVFLTFYWIGQIIIAPFKLIAKIRFLRLKIPKPRFHLPKIPPAKLFYLKLKLFREKLKSILRPARAGRLKPKLRLNVKRIIFFLSLLFLFFIFYFLFLKDLPSPKELVTRKQEVSTKIYDRNKVLLYKIYKNQNRTPVNLSRIPNYVRLATLAAEDAEFYNHLGFSIRGIGRALIKNIKEGKLAGGSTITQQLVKNALLSPEKTIIRKIRELILSIGVEITFSKDQILEMYLNEVSYGGTAYGIQEAAQVYFGKNVNQLSLAEAALLAGLPKSPTKFSPFGANPDQAIARQKDVLNLMVINKFISEEEAQKALQEKLVFKPNKTEIMAPHFVMFVKQFLVDKYGEEMVEKGGLEVITTLDYKIQKMAESAVANEVRNLARFNVGNGAALVLDPTTGEILAMVGSKDYFNIKNDGNVNVTTSLRQPGSSIKIVNYAYALSNNFTAATILNDSPISYVVPGQPIYSPKNYDDKYRGRLPLRNALAESRNIPAVKVLASYGVEKMIEMGKKMGVTTWNDSSQYGLSLTLGGGEVKLIDLALVYTTVANYGQKPELASIIKITNYKGKILEENRCNYPINQSCNFEQILNPRVAFLLIDILKDNVARTPAFGANSSLVIPRHPEVAVKTGTSNNLKDNLTLGFNQKYLVAVWVGNNDATPMAKIASGITGAAPIWNKIMSTLLVNEDSIKWEVPQGVSQLPICLLTGTLSCEGCPTKTEWFLDEKKPTSHCNSEQILKIQEEKKSSPNPSPTGQVLIPAASTQRR
jgi:1A family penicillin-binding protein